VKALAIAVLLAACSDAPVDKPEVAAAKVECRKLEAHVFRISPQSAPKFAGLSEADAQQLADSMVAKLAAEDIDQCAAGEPEIIACMQTAADVAAIKACVPSDKVIACMQKAKKAPEIRVKCAADPKAADALPQ
jgi:hypothetical protein